MANTYTTRRYYPVTELGYMGDGRSHPLSSISTWRGIDTRHWTLSQWQTAFPRATGLSDEIDRHAIQRLCDLDPQRVLVDLPPGTAVIDKGIVTGGRQNVHIRGAGRDLTELWFFEAGGTFWGHGLTTASDGTWTVEDVTVRPKAVCAAAFHVRFSGKQPAWCHILRNVQFVPDDIVSYFQNACITSNVKRGLDWQNVVAYGHHFHVLSTNAFEFPSNIDQTTAGNSYNFNNIMSVGYAYAMNFDFTNFVSTRNHMHEEAQFYNVQAYAGVGLLRAKNGNYRFAPADNFTLAACGWQGSGPALDLQYLEHVRVRDTLLVNDSVSEPTTCFAKLEDCDSVIFDGNEIFSPAGRDITGLTVCGPRTRNIAFVNNDVVAYSQFDSFLLITADVPEGGVNERETHFAGTATYRNGKVADRSGFAVSETRTFELAANAGQDSASVDVMPNGDITWDAISAQQTNRAGFVQINLPPSLFRTVRTVAADNVDSKVTSWVTISSFDTTRVIAHYPQPGIPPGTVIRTHLRVIGR